MSPARSVLVVALLTSALVPGARAQNGIAWFGDFTRAREIAQREQRLILVHFIMDNCGPCQVLERDVFPHPDVAFLIAKSYVAVKIDARRDRAAAQHFGIDQVPTDVVLDSQGTVLHRSASPLDPTRYAQMLHGIANSQPAVPPAASGLPPAAYSTAAEMRPAAVAPVHPVSAAAETRLALDGCCPVTLFEKEEWAKGDPRFGAVHRERTYLFASAQDHERFMADPDRYSPVLSGYDPTAYIDRGELVPGHRDYGVWYRGRVNPQPRMYLFADEASLDRFERSPDFYAQKAHEVMMSLGQ